jgi:hypothetical protein
MSAAHMDAVVLQLVHDARKESKEVFSENTQVGE